MTEKRKKPKWLKKLKKLMASASSEDKQALKVTLEKLKLKSNELKLQIDQCENPEIRGQLLEKWHLVKKHRKKGIKKLKEWGEE